MAVVDLQVRVTYTNAIGTSWSEWARLTKTGKVTRATSQAKGHRFDADTARVVAARLDAAIAAANARCSIPLTHRVEIV